MVNIKILSEVADNRKLLYFLKDLSMGITIGLFIYAIEERRLYKED